MFGGGIWLDLAGLSLFAVAAGWTYFSASVSGGNPAPIAKLFGASFLAYAAGRLGGAINRALVPTAIILGAGFLWFDTPGGIFSRAPLAPPFGYANSKGTFFALATIAALMVLVSVPGIVLKIGALLVAIAFALVPIRSGTLAAALIVLVLPALCLLIVVVASWRTAVTVFGLLFLTALLVTVVMGASYTAPGRSALVEATITEQRPILWNEGISIMLAHPLTGVGPARFQEVSPSALRDKDYRWAHNAFIQQGAESGVLGMFLLVALFLWGFIRLRAVNPGDALTALGAAALASLGIHASIDYVMHFAVVPITTAALVGASSNSRPTL